MEFTNKRKIEHDVNNTSNKQLKIDAIQMFRNATMTGNLQNTEQYIGTVDANYINEGLHFACYNGHLEIVKLLIKNGADVNSQFGNRFGDTPLIEACSEGYFDIIKYLVEHGANINICNNVDESPLFTAGLYADYTMSSHEEETGQVDNYSAFRKSLQFTEITQYLIKNGAIITF